MKLEILKRKLMAIIDDYDWGSDDLEELGISIEDCQKESPQSMIKGVVADVFNTVIMPADRRK